MTYWRVVRRQQKIVIWGLALTGVLALFMLVKVSPSGVALRSPPTYMGKSTLFVTQSGFPEGRSALTEYVRARGTSDSEDAVPRFADAGRMVEIATLYATLAKSDVVRDLVKKKRGIVGEDEYDVAALTEDGTALPLIEVVAFSDSGPRSVKLANRVASDLQRYVSRLQRENGIPEKTRISLPVITRADAPEVFEGVKLTGPFMIALLGFVATLFAAFTVDNVRRQRWLAEEVGDVPEPEQRVHHLTTAANEDDQAGDDDQRQHRRRGTRGG